MKKISLATKRAMNYPAEQKQWFCYFEYSEVKGLGYEEGVHRRDPSSIISHGGKYYVYYTRSTGESFGRDLDHPERKMFPWDRAEIWYATSEDGKNWQEKGCAVPLGKPGSYDERTVCTPDILAHGGKFYLVYQAVQNPYTKGRETVGMSIADSPYGPWVKVAKPVYKPFKGEITLKGSDQDNYNRGKFGASIQDPMLLFYRGKYYLYHKCMSLITEDGLSRTVDKYSGCDTRWGVALSENPQGPYIASEYNPITNSGHETLLWPYDGGIAALINRDGPEKDTIQWSPDGVNFEIKSVVDETPWAGATFRPENPDSHPLSGLQWGLCHKDEGSSKWNYIMRFDTVRH